MGRFAALAPSMPLTMSRPEMIYEGNAGGTDRSSRLKVHHSHLFQQAQRLEKLNKIDILVREWPRASAERSSSSAPYRLSRVRAPHEAAGMPCWGLHSAEGGHKPSYHGIEKGRGEATRLARGQYYCASTRSCTSLYLVPAKHLAVRVKLPTPLSALSLFPLLHSPLIPPLMSVLPSQ